MQGRHRIGVSPAGKLPALVLGSLLAFSAWQTPAKAQAPQLPPMEELLSGVVEIKTYINPDARTTENLGRERRGSGIVIDSNGLVLTIGYLMVEAHSAEITTNDGRTIKADILGYDNDTGFGLLKALGPLKVRPFQIGKSGELKEKEPVLAASFGGAAGLAPAVVVSRREFAAGWEYLVDQAIFTAPAHNEWSGAALINRDGKLVGVGSLIVGNAIGKGDNTIAGNMYVPIDLLTPILADLLADGRVQGPGRPWLGITTEEVRGKLFIGRVAPGGPAEKAGLKKGDIIVGVNGKNATGLANLYKQIWASGAAGVTVPLDVIGENGETGVKRIEVKSINRLDHLKLKSTL